MHSKFMFLFLTFFLIVTCCTFDSMGTDLRDLTASKAMPQITIKKIQSAPLEIKKPSNLKLYSDFSAEVLFSKGKEVVPSKAKMKIKEIFEEARKYGEIHSAKIISWGDRLRSETKRKSLTSSELKLVEDRNDNIEAYLERLDLQLVVRKISMGERPEIMDGLLSKEDRKLKKHLEFHAVSAKSKSIVMFVLKNNQ